MIIAIDGYEANVESRVGISRYAHEVLSHIYNKSKRNREQGEADEPTFRVYLPSIPLPHMPPETPWWQYKVGGPKKLWTFVRLPLFLASDMPSADVVFSPTHYIPRFTSIPRVVSIMDMSFLQYPQLFKKKDAYKLTTWTRYSARNAKAICTISEFSKNAIIHAYTVPKERVTVTYPGFSSLTAQSMTSIDLSKKYHMSVHYILSVGTLQPRKNYVRLIEAFSRFLKLNKQKFKNITLVIVGKKGWLYREILDAPSRYGVGQNVVFLDFVPDRDLPGLYSNALCFALPSLYEGFGLPVLEAMAYGCPVVVSNVSSLPEIAGKAGVYVEPESVDSITNGLLTAVRQRNLIQGKRRLQIGLAQTKKFTWEKAASKTLELLQQVGGAR